MYASPDKINKKIDRFFGTDNKKLSKIQQKYKFELENDNLLSEQQTIQKYKVIYQWNRHLIKEKNIRFILRFLIMI